jgi:hypothetical protein
VLQPVVHANSNLGRDSLTVAEHRCADNSGITGIEQRLSAYDNTNPVAFRITLRFVGTINLSLRFTFGKLYLPFLGSLIFQAALAFRLCTNTTAKRMLYRAGNITPQP